MNAPLISSDQKEILYLYCLAVSKDLPDIQGVGIDDQYPLFLNRINGVAAVLSHARLDDFTGEKGADNLQDIHWIAPRACRHQDVVSRVMKRSPVLPIRFGTLYLSETSLHQMVRLRHNAVTAFLKEVAGREEWAVKGYINKKKRLKQMGASLMAQVSEVTAPEEQESCEHPLKAAGQNAPGTRYFQQKKLEQQAETLLNQSVHHSIMAIADILEPLSVDINERDLMSRAATGKDMDMVLNWAALLDKDDIDLFNGQIEKINLAYEKEGLVLEFSGPWPPYSFCPAIDTE